MKKNKTNIGVRFIDKGEATISYAISDGGRRAAQSYIVHAIFLLSALRMAGGFLNMGHLQAGAVAWLAGTLAVLREGAYLWTDGRYFLQAERQLEGSGIQLMRAGQPGVPTLSQFLAEQLPESGALGFDGRTVSTRLHRTLEKALADKHIRLDGGFDPAAGVWTDRPDLSTAPVWAFDSGVTRWEKLTALRQDMAAQKAEWLLLTDLTDVAWALELRGGDVACTPVFLGFLLVGTDSAALYAQAESFTPEIRAALAADGAALRQVRGRPPAGPGLRCGSCYQPRSCMRSAGGMVEMSMPTMGSPRSREISASRA